MSTQHMRADFPVISILTASPIYTSIQKHEKVRRTSPYCCACQTVFITTDAGKDALNDEAEKLGVQRDGWVGVADMMSLSKQLLTPSTKRATGIHEAQPVLVRAGPGTGKTWSLQQLGWLLAKEMKNSTEGVRPVPLLVRVQRLARYAKASERAGFDNLLLAYIDKEFKDTEKSVVLQAYALRSLVVVLDGIDEAAALKFQIEDLVLHDLNDAGLRTVVSSRPEVHARAVGPLSWH